MLKGYQKLCIRRCPLNNTGVYHSPHWDIVGMDITPCDITCITGVISNTVILHMAVMIRLYATILPFPVILRRRIKPEGRERSPYVTGVSSGGAARDSGAGSTFVFSCTYLLY